MKHNHYPRLAVMIALSFIAMYALMYAMVDGFDNVFNSFNQFYMAGLMTAAMVIIELSVMGMMYHNKRMNVAIIVASVLALAGCWIAIRQQTAISDKQFVRSMIPHHAGAILMCDEASIEDPELLELCKSIKASQRSEIDRMKRILDRLER
jgi:uncharacterized protein (DUF305 family)